jgi:uncharacterized protein (AIM24 family)
MKGLRILIFGAVFLLPLSVFPQGLTHLWSQGWGDTLSQYGQSAAFDPWGNVVMTGGFEGTVDFGGGPLNSAGYDDIFLVKFDANGSHLWSQGFGDGSVQQGRSLSIDPSGNVVVTGEFEDTVDFGGGPLTSGGGNDIFLAKFDTNGSHLWSQSFGGFNEQISYGVAFDPSGNVVITGEFEDTLDFGGGPLISAGGLDIFLAKFDTNGTHLWSQGFGDVNGNQQGRSLSIDPSGNIVITGEFDGTVDFGGGPLTSAGGNDIFLAKFDTNGTHLWSQSFGDTSFQRGYSVDFDPSGNVVMTGQFQGTVDFGGGPLTSAGGNDIFLVKFDSNGTHLWSQGFGDTDYESGRSLSIDPSGDIVVTGSFRDTVDFGGGPLTSAGGNDIFLVKFDTDGTHNWSQGFGDTLWQNSYNVAFDLSGNVAMTGYFEGTVDFGGGNLPIGGEADIFLAKFGPSVGVEEESNDEYRTRNIEFRLNQNNPNPFNKLTAISYIIPSNPESSIPHHVSLNIYDISGRLVKTLVDEPQDPGIYQLPITNDQLPGSGIYFYRLKCGDFSTTKKMIFFK